METHVSWEGSFTEIDLGVKCREALWGAQSLCRRVSNLLKTLSSSQCRWHSVDSTVRDGDQQAFPEGYASVLSCAQWGPEPVSGYLIFGKFLTSAKMLPHQNNGTMAVEEVKCDKVYKAFSTVSVSMVHVREMSSSSSLLSSLDLVNRTHGSMEMQLLAQGRPHSMLPVPFFYHMQLFRTFVTFLLTVLFKVKTLNHSYLDSPGN